MNPKLVLKKLSADEVRLSNVAIGRAREIVFEMGATPCRLQFRQASSEYQALAGIKLKVGEHDIVLGLADMPPVSFFTQEYPELELGNLEKDLCPVVFESINQPLLDNLESLFGLPVTIETVSLHEALKDDDYAHKLYFTVQKEDETFSRFGHLAFNEDFIPLLLSRFPKDLYADNLICDDIDVDVKLILANEAVSFNDWKSVERNDLLLLDDLSSIKSGQYNVVLANKYIFEGNYKDGQITLEKLMNEIEEAFEDEEEPLLEDEEEPSEVSEEEAEFEDDVEDEDNEVDELAELNGTHKGIDALPVKLSFEVGQKTVKVGDLKTLQPGFTFKMDNPIDMPIVIRANGKKIGTGELVKVGEQMAVRITRFTKNG